MQLFHAPVLGLFLVSGILGLLTTIFMIWMLVDALTNSALDGTMKLIWVLVILFLPLIGSILYFLIARGGNVGRPRI